MGCTGKPGTGKTKFVLSYAVANFFRKKYLVLILAPTNHALDQTLSGILPALEKLNMDLFKIIRLGTATDNIPDNYAFLCESSKTNNELNSINKKQASLKSSLIALQKR